ncbi:uncharacterized protein CTRU02_213813 [Colletotrichum truncatum]|uniref:Uncharacterized protein n=1 Tax=Colletotrichum truncatum TaxID=5467 RepID=A0ACC3YGT0_COLTU|nr:uncharacterized protein CTRU02_12835 [Colletotrichum truncatum]KAF6784068.1 hypothetical protein CTRU02_12835 [Colletotrichum truncatum]
MDHQLRFNEPAGDDYVGDHETIDHDYGRNYETTSHNYGGNYEATGHEYGANYETTGHEYGGNYETTGHDYGGNNETTGDEYVENYNIDSALDDVTAPPCPFYGTESYGEYGDSAGYPYEFGDRHHLTLTNFDQDTALANGAYSPDIELDQGGVNSAAPTAFPPQSPSPLQFHQPTSDPRVALAQVNVNLPYRDNSSWDPVAATAVPYAPNFGGVTNVYGHTLPSSTATRSQADALSYLGSPGPSTWDGVSTRSGHTDSSSTACEMCGRPFGNSRQMRRHRQEVHRESHDPQYVCKCSYQATRKYNYIRHLKTTCKKRRDPSLWFTCICQVPFDNYEDHLAHVETCGRGQPGRPPNSTRNVLN